MVTWSEQYPGGVIAGRIKLAGVVNNAVTDDNVEQPPSESIFGG